MLTELQKATAQAIVNIFETGTVRGEYGKVTLLRGDTGHLTYGKSQTTLGSGNLYLLIKSYCEEPRAQFGSQLRKYLSRMKVVDLSLDKDRELHNVLEMAGSDEVMQVTQDAFFDRVYWNPSQVLAQGIGIVSALGSDVVYDSCVHGSWKRIKDKVIADFGTIAATGEREWVTNFVQTRRDWLAQHENPLLRRTVYRMDSFRELITSAKWDLPLPIRVRGVTIDELALAGITPIRVSAVDGKQHNLMLQSPRMKGADVKGVQRALAVAGFPTTEDGMFGKETDNQVRNFQKHNHLKPDGIVGPATLAALGV